MARRPAEVERLEVAAYTIPTDQPEQDGTLDWDSTTMVVVHVHAGGEVGLGYTYAPAATAELINEKLAPVVCSGDALSPPAAWRRMKAAVRNAGLPGVCAMGISAVDVALWDLKARCLGLPLAVLLGAARQSVPIYGSGGFTSYSDQHLQRQLGDWVRAGIPRVKMKVGRDAQRDLQRVALARREIGDAPELFVDANGAYQPGQALELARTFRERWDVTWFEEPRPSGDVASLRELRQRVPGGIDIAAGEYGYDLLDFRRLLENRAVDVLQMDVTRCGGVTGALAAAALADAFETETSAHCAPALHAHLGCALPRMRHIEYFHDHVRIESLLLEGVPRLQDGCLVIDLEEPGLGLTFRDADGERFRASVRSSP